MKNLMSLSKIVRTVRSEVTWKRILLAVIFAMNLRIFEFFPHVRPLEEGWFVLCLVIFGIFYTLFKSQSDWRFSLLELYLLGLMIVLIAVPAASAYGVFGQPLYYGILARRSSILITTWLLLINAWKRRWVDADDIEKVLVSLMWFVAILFLGMRLLISPSAFPDAPTGFILGFGTENQAFSAPGYLFPFGNIYYAVKGMRGGSIRDYLFAAAIFLVGAGSSWRALFLSMSLTLLFFLFQLKPLPKAILMLTQFAIVTLVLVGLLNIVKPNLVADTVGHFVSAIRIAVGGEQEHLDASADARVEEIALALPYVKAHPIFGSGALSGQWNGGPSSVLGGYFSDADIGLLGTLFTFGLVGMVYSSFQYLFAIKAALRAAAQNQGALFDAVKGFLLFSAIFSITTSFFVVEVESTSFYVVLIVLLARESPATVVAGERKQIEGRRLQFSA